MMRLTRKLYSDPEDEEDDNDERTWKRRRNIGIIGAGTGGVLALGGHLGEKGISGAAKDMIKKDGGRNFRSLRGIGAGLGIAGASLGVASEIKRRKLKKKHDENKA